MKNTKLLVTSAILALTFIIGQSVSNAAGCGEQYIYKTSKPFCANEWCGLWDKTALVQKQYIKRNCVKKDSTTKWEYDINRVHIDCGC